MLALFLAGCTLLRTRSEITYLAEYERPLAGSKVAARKHLLALKALEECDFCKAESLAKEALAADGKFGPAHNSLGAAFFAQRLYYPAAWEFEYAAKMMPDRPEPLNNLGLVYEAVNRLDDAVVQFETAWGLDESNAEYLGNLVRAMSRRGDPKELLDPYFQRLVELDSRRDWVRWANDQLNFVRPRQSSTVEEMMPRQTPELLELEEIPLDSRPVGEGVPPRLTFPDVPPVESDQ